MSTPSNQIQPQLQITFTLKELKCLSFELTDYANSNTKQIASDGYEFQFNLELLIFEETKSTKLALITTLLEKVTEKEKHELAKLKAELTFVVVNFWDVFKTQGDKILIPDQLITAFSNIAIGGVRGMFVIKLEGTRFSNAILPLLDSKIFLPKRLDTVS